VPARKPQQRESKEDKCNGKHDVAAVQGGCETGLSFGAGNDDCGDDGHGSCEDSAEEWGHAPVHGAFADHLAGHGGYDAGADARQQ